MNTPIMAGEAYASNPAIMPTMPPMMLSVLRQVFT